MKVTNLSKRYRRKWALDDVSFELDERCTALLGPNGAGKTTLITCIAGLVSPTSGTVTASKGDTKLKVGYLPQQFSFLPNLTVRESLAYLGQLSGIRHVNLAEEVTAVITQTNLTEYEDMRLKALSGGTMRRLGVAQALLGSPELLLLDEPTAGLDIEERGKLKAVLARVKESHQILLSTHIVGDIIGLCDRVLVLKAGQLVFDGRLEELTSFAKGRVCISNDETPRARGGIASGSSFAADSTEYRYVMPQTVSEYGANPTIEDGYLALLHGYTD